MDNKELQEYLARKQEIPTSLAAMYESKTPLERLDFIENLEQMLIKTTNYKK